MPNIAKLLKDEIQRLAKKETKQSAVTLKKDTVALKKAMAALKKQLAQLRREVRSLVSAESRRAKLAPAVAPEQAGKLRFSAKGIRALRRKLKLSQADFARLVGVSSLAVYQWERKEGRLALRQGTKNKLAEIKGIGRRDALKRLDAMTGEGKKKKLQKRGKRRGPKGRRGIAKRG